MRRTFLLFVFVGFPVLFSIAHAAQVEGLQPPAWVERAGQKLVLRAGLDLHEADTIATGAGGRLLVRLSDGGLVKLGENARLVLESLDEDAAGGILKDLFRPSLEVRIATTTIGIRGTDVWGRSQDGGATVCLIEGRISMHHPARGEFVMDQPLSFFIAPREGEPHPVGPVDATKLKQWAAEIELEPGQGVLLPGGGWIVQLGSHASAATARAAARRLNEQDIPVELVTVQHKDRTFYRLRVNGFDTQGGCAPVRRPAQGPARCRQPLGDLQYSGTKLSVMGKAKTRHLPGFCSLTSWRPAPRSPAAVPIPRRKRISPFRLRSACAPWDRAGSGGIR